MKTVNRQLLIITVILLTWGLLINALVRNAYSATTASVMHNPKFVAIDENGDPLAGGKLYTYETGTTTPKTTYTDYSMGTPNANPIILDDNGECNLWLDSSGGNYTLLLKDADDVTQWTINGVQAINDETIDDKIAAALASSAAGQNFYYPDATAADQGVAVDGDTTIKDMVDAIGANNATIVLARGSSGATTSYTVTTAETIPSNITLVIESGAQIAGAGNLTIEGPLDAPIMQIFNSSGDISFGNDPLVKLVYTEWWGATGDGTTDDTTAIQAAVDSLGDDDGGVIQFLAKTYECNITTKQYLTLQGVYGGTGITDGATPSDNTILLAHSSGAVIDTASGTDQEGICIRDMQIQGLGAGTACKGIRFRQVLNSRVENVVLYNLSDEGILDSSGTRNTYTNIRTYNCVLNRTQASVIGAVDTNCDYMMMSNVQARTYSDSTPSLSAAGNINGIVVRGDYGYINNAVGESSDGGIYVSGDSNKFSNCNALTNYGHGWEIASTAFGNQYATCSAHRNGQESTNSYSGFLTYGRGEVFAGCIALSLAGDGWAHRYGFQDDSTATTDPTEAYLRNTFIGCRSVSAATGEIDSTTEGGSSFITGNGNFFDFADGDTTPSVAGGTLFRTANTGATTITDFDDGTPGQVIHLVINDDNTEIDNSADIQLDPRTDTTYDSGRSIMLIHVNGVWREVKDTIVLSSDTGAGAGADGTISSRNANALGECDGFITFENQDGDSVYVPFWDDITP
jgi:hypothetical protein